MSDLQRLTDLIKAGDFVVLDTEATTKYPSTADICQIAIIDAFGHTLLDTLVKPGEHIPNSFIHGITDDMVKDSPSIGDLAPSLYELLHKRNVIIYNASYDHPIITRLTKGKVPGGRNIGFKSVCAMLAYTEHKKVWNDYRGNWAWWELTEAAAHIKYALPAGMKAHSALGDCLMTMAVCQHMAAS